MDRLDAWLNAQRGRRRLALLWLSVYPPTLIVGNAYLGWQFLTAANSPPGADYLWLLALAVPGAAVLAGLLLLVRASRSLRAIQRGKFQQPLFSWRGTGFILLLMTSFAVDQYETLESAGWHQRHHALAVISFICLACGLVLLFDNMRYLRRLRRLSDSQPSLLIEGP